MSEETFPHYLKTVRSCTLPDGQKSSFRRVLYSQQSAHSSSQRTGTPQEQPALPSRQQREGRAPGSAGRQPVLPVHLAPRTGSVLRSSPEEAAEHRQRRHPLSAAAPPPALPARSHVTGPGSRRRCTFPHRAHAESGVSRGHARVTRTSARERRAWERREATPSCPPARGAGAAAGAGAGSAGSPLLTHTPRPSPLRRGGSGAAGCGWRRSSGAGPSPHAAAGDDGGGAGGGGGGFESRQFYFPPRDWLRGVTSQGRPPAAPRRVLTAGLPQAVTCAGLRGPRGCRGARREL